MRRVGILDADHEGRKGELICTDGGMDGCEANVVYSETIPFTDFPLEEIELCNDGGILCLPGER
jgi:hypothetical protein